MRAFIGKHQFVLAIFGAFLALASFFAKDVSQERDKELNSTLAQAKTSHDDLALLNQIDDEVASIAHLQVIQIMHNSSPQAHLDTVRRYYKNQLQTDQKQDVGLFNVDREIVKALPHYRPTLAKESDQIGGQLTYNQSAINRFGSDVTAGSADEKLADGTYFSRYNEHKFAEQEIAHFEADVLSEAHDQQETLKHKVEILTVLTCVLFGIGWLLGIIGEWAKEATEQSPIFCIEIGSAVYSYKLEAPDGK